MRHGGADGADDPLADARDDGFFPCAADEAIQVGPNGDARLGLDLNAVHRDAVHRHPALLRVGAVNHLRRHAGLHRCQHVASGEVNGAGAVERQCDVRLARRDERLDDATDVSAGQVMRLEFLGRDRQTGLDGGNARRHDRVRVHFPQSHRDERQELDVRAGDRRLDVEPAVLEDEDDQHKADEAQNDQPDGGRASLQLGEHERRIQHAHCYLLPFEESNIEYRTLNIQLSTTPRKTRRQLNVGHWVFNIGYCLPQFSTG